MARRNNNRFRIGKVTVYLHYGAWWLYFSEQEHRVRRKVSASREEAEQVAAQINSQVTNGSPTPLSFEPIGVPELRQQLPDKVVTVPGHRCSTFPWSAGPLHASANPSGRGSGEYHPAHGRTLWPAAGPGRDEDVPQDRPQRGDASRPSVILCRMYEFTSPSTWRGRCWGSCVTKTRPSHRFLPRLAIWATCWKGSSFFRYVRRSGTRGHLR